MEVFVVVICDKSGVRDSNLVGIASKIFDCIAKFRAMHKNKERCPFDSSEYRYQSGNDLYLSRIIKGSLEPEDITSIAQAHRKMRDTFINDPSIEAINNKINQDASLTDKKIALSVGLVPTDNNASERAIRGIRSKVAIRPILPHIVSFYLKLVELG